MDCLSSAPSNDCLEQKKDKMRCLHCNTILEDDFCGHLCVDPKAKSIDDGIYQSKS